MAADVLVEGPVDGPRRPEDLERGEPEPARLVFDPDDSELQLGRERRCVDERRGTIAGKAAVELERITTRPRPVSRDAGGILDQEPGHPLRLLPSRNEDEALPGEIPIESKRGCEVLVSHVLETH